MNARDRRFWAALEPLLIKVIQEKRRMLRARCKFVCDGVTHREGGKKAISLATRYDQFIATREKAEERMARLLPVNPGRRFRVVRVREVEE